ncbi:MAG TPA: class I SAM-dependent methyltransferase [Beijerinckiaceae bacterium]|jgi:SAM-dependent methyltransferase|nr:class I SAM-dependent methyltransferase [Beijerinckiaceae bacterium]
MNGFSAEWLALREPIDHRSINEELRAELLAWVGQRAHVRIADLGSGSGSNLRGLAPLLPKSQHWRLMDHDEALLDHANLAITAWADEFAGDDDRISVRIKDKKLTLDFVQADLAEEPAAVFDEPLDLVTASAFFDLVSEEWIDDFCRELAARKLPLYAVLTYDGTETWTPPHEADAAMLAAFHAHQGRDKGFGAAAGPQAAAILRRALERHGYRVSTGDSPWLLERPHRALIAELAKGSAAAVRETGQVAPEQVEAWLAARREASACEIGHIDLFALPA